MTIINLQAEVEAYNRDGFLIVREAVRGEQMLQLERELAKLRDEVESGLLRGNHLMETQRTARVVFNPYDHSPMLRKLAGRT